MISLIDILANTNSNTVIIARLVRAKKQTNYAQKLLLIVENYLFLYVWTYASYILLLKMSSHILEKREEEEIEEQRRGKKLYSLNYS